MNYWIGLVALLMAGQAFADERLEAAQEVMSACFEAAESHELELGCLGNSVRACTANVEDPNNPELLPCVEAETAVWRDLSDGRLESLMQIIRDSEDSDAPCTPSVEECVAQVRKMNEGFKRQGEAACEQAAQIASVDGYPDLGRAVCIMREEAIRSARLAGLRRANQ